MGTQQASRVSGIACDGARKRGNIPLKCESAKLSSLNLARYQTYLTRVEDTNGGEEVVRTRSGRTLRMRPTRCRLQERPRKKRHVLQSMARPLKKWLIRHRDKPYPTKAEKIALAMASHMTLEQVSNWFANARRRLKNTVYIPGVNWGDRIRQYNNFISGNSEPLSISSDDSIWDSDGPDHDSSFEKTNGAGRGDCVARNEHSEHSYSTAVFPRTLEGQVSALSNRPTRPCLKRSWEGRPVTSEPSAKRNSPMYDSDSATDESSLPTNDGDVGDTGGHLPETEKCRDRSKRQYGNETRYKKYKTTMLLRYIGADEETQTSSDSTTVATTKQTSRGEKRKAEDKPGKDANVSLPKKRNCENAARSKPDLHWTEIEAAEALTCLSQSGATYGKRLCTVPLAPS